MDTQLGKLAPVVGQAIHEQVAGCGPAHKNRLPARSGKISITHCRRQATDIGTLGFLGIDDSVPVGEFGLRLIFRIGAENATPERLRELVNWIKVHSPVGDSVSRAIPTQVAVEVV